MADEQKDLNEITDLPQEVRDWVEARAAGTARPATLDALFPGNHWSSVRASLQDRGFATYNDDKGAEHIIGADLDKDGYVMAVAAAIPRSGGKSYDFLSGIDDFQNALTADNATSRKDALALYNKIYRADGMTNNAITKLSALVAPDGEFKVRSVKGVRGKSGDKRAAEATSLLNWWKNNVNARGDDQVITGDRGITSFVVRGARLCLIEGDHIARHFWPKKAVAVPNIGNFSLPMNLQTFSAQHIDIPKGLEGTNYELLYWVPPKQFINQLQSPDDPNVGKMLKKLIPADVRNALVNDGQYLLDPNLLIHIKNKGTGVDTFGESMIEPTLADLKFKRALDALMLTVITNMIARMVVVKIGSDNKDSVYHKQEVTQARLGLLQRMMRNAGPTPTLLWGGPDLEIVQISAHDALPSVEALYKIAERRHLMALGMPAVLMIGEGSDGKSVAFAAALTVAAMLLEIQNQYKQALQAIGERILTENGYEEVDVVWEWKENLLEDKTAAATLVVQLWQAGLLDYQTALEELGFDPDAVESRMGDDVSKGVRPGIFQPPVGLVAKNPGGAQNGGGGSGRPAGTGTPDPRTNTETSTNPQNAAPPQN